MVTYPDRVTWLQMSMACCLRSKDTLEATAGRIGIPGAFTQGPRTKTGECCGLQDQNGSQWDPLLVERAHEPATKPTDSRVTPLTP